jgi:hypothetical protein
MDKRDHKQRYEAGLKTRREVLGAHGVAKAMAGEDDDNPSGLALLYKRRKQRLSRWPGLIGSGGQEPNEEEDGTNPQDSSHDVQESKSKQERSRCDEHGTAIRAVQW